jgi:hypothetical protein
LTRTKLWRLSLAAILGFGWLFLTPAYSDDPLSLAAQEIQKLSSNVADLNYKTEFQSLIDIAESKYDDAVDAKQVRDDASGAYDAAVIAEATALQEKSSAQSAVDGQTVIVATALTNKNNAQDELDVALINLNTANTNLQTAQSAVNNAGSAGLQYTVYHLLRDGYLNGQHLAVPGSVICNGVWNSASMNLPVCGYYEDIIVKFTGVITVPSWFSTTYFAGYTDDGFKMYVNGSLAVNNWVEQGATWSPMSPVYDVSQDKTLDVEIWWYNGGGPGSYHLGWAIPGGWTSAGCDYAGNPRVWGQNFSCNLNTFSYGSQPTQQQLNNLTAAQTAKTAAENTYNTKLAVRNDKLSVYNSEVSTLNACNQTLTVKTNAYNTAVTNTANALTTKNNAITAYDQSIVDLNESIDAAWEYYEEQLAREIAIAIAQAAANAAANQPTPEPSPEQSSSPEPTPEPTPEQTLKPEPSPQPTPSHEPSPEQTAPVDPTPEPTPETTDEPKPEPTVDPETTPEPSPEPSPQPTDINPEPTPEPKPTPAEPSQRPSTNTITDDLSALANLTSKDNVVIKLTPEQAAAVANVLVELKPEQKAAVAKDFGIKTEEITVIAAAMKENPILASAVVEFSSRAKENAEAPMPYTLADATTELQTEALLADPIGALTNIDLEKVLNPSEWGKDMTDDQREKAQEVIVPVIIASNIVAAAMTRRIG